MQIEREDKQRIFWVVVSAFFFAMCLFGFYIFRGDPGSDVSYTRLANLKSVIDKGVIRTQTEAFGNFILFFNKKVFGLKVLNAYHITLALIFSFTLHFAMLNFYRKEWRLNHFFLIYLVGFVPFSINLPYFYMEELLCFLYLLILNYNFKLEKIGDLFLIAVLSFFAFLSSFPGFLLGGFVTVSWICLGLIREKRAKTSVFFKRKNVPLRFLMTFYGLFAVSILIFSLTDFFGVSSFSFLMHSFWNLMTKFFPIFLVMKIAEYLLRSEKELNTLGTTAVVIVATLVSGYFVFSANKNNGEQLKKVETEILSLKNRGRINPQETKIYGPRALSDYAFYHSGEEVESKDIANMKKSDLLLLFGVTEEDRVLIEKKNSFQPGYFSIDQSVILIQKDFVEKLLMEPEESELKTKLEDTVRAYPSSNLTPYEKMNRFFNQMFGF